jgi:multidrug resistance protein
MAAGKGYSARMHRLTRSPLALMALTVFIDITGFGLVIPLLPFWAERLGAGPAGVGVALTLYALAQFLFTPVLGALSDRHGRRPVILASLLIEALAFALTALAGSFAVLLVARFIGGLGASNLGSAQAVVADVTPPDRRARGMGLIGAAIGLGFVVGPALGGVLAAVGPAAPFWAAMLVALANVLLVLRFLPETRRATSSAAASDRPRRGVVALFRGWDRARRHPAALRLIAINALFTLAFAGMEAVFPLFTQRAFGWGAPQNGYVFTYVGVIIVLMQGGLVGRLVARFGERTLLRAGLVLLAAGLLLLPLAANLALLLLAIGILSVGEGAVTPTSSTLLSFASPRGAQGELLGLAQGAGGLGRALGPLAATALFAAGRGLPFIAGALLALSAAGLALSGLPAGPRTAGVHARRAPSPAAKPSTAARRELVAR